MRPAVAILWLAGLLAVLAVGCLASAQTEPPPLGMGDWVVGDATVLQDRYVMLRGDLRVTAGGDMTLRNSTILFAVEEQGQYGIVVEGGGALRILEGSRLGSARVGVAYTLVAMRGSTVRILDSTVDSCGRPPFGAVPDWTNISVYIGTDDVLVERSSFSDGLVSLVLTEGALAPAVRNCTFEGLYGVVTFGTSVEDCTFIGQSYYGVLVWGGTTTRVERCTFTAQTGAGVMVGMDERIMGVGPIDVATAVVRDCLFVRAATGVRVAVESHATVESCIFETLSGPGIWPEPGELNDPPERRPFIELHDGAFRNCSRAIEPEWHSTVNWRVSSRSEVVGGNLTLAGDLVLEEGARLELVGCRDLTQANRLSQPVSVILGSHSTLRMVGGRLLAPRDDDGGTDWRPVRIVGGNGTLVLEDVSEVMVAFPVDIGHLEARRTRLPVGQWSAMSLELADCELVGDLSGGSPMLEVHSPTTPGISHIARCSIEGLPVVGPGGVEPWLVLRDAHVVCQDTLWDVVGLGRSGEVLFTGQGASSLTINWTARVSVVWQNRRPVPGAEVVVRDSKGGALHRTADANGTVAGLVLTSEWESHDFFVMPGGLTEMITYRPFTFEASASGIAGSVEADTLGSPLDVVVTLVDDVGPELVLDQGAFIATNRASVRITGNASDAHSGLAFLEAAILPHAYERVALLPGGAFEAELRLGDGSQTASVRLYDAVGNRVERTLTVYHTTRPPGILLTEPAQGGWSNTTLVAVAGWTEVGATVEVRARSQQATDGSFRMLVPLPEGPSVVFVNVTDLAGNRNQSMFMVTVDTVPPPITLVDVPPLTNSSALDVHGTTEAGARAFIDGVEAEVDGQGRFTARVPLREGLQTITVTVMDAASNIAARETAVVLDSTPPPLGVLWPTEDGLRTNASFIIVRVLTDVGVRLTINGKVVATPDPEVIHKLALEEGANVVTVVASDAVGNSASVVRTVLVWRRSPQLALNPAPPERTSDAHLIISGTTVANATVAINGLAMAVGPGGGFSRTVLLNAGHNRIVINATDEYGNSVAVEYDVEMVPATVPPRERPPSLVLPLVGLTVLVLVVEAVVLLLRRGGAPRGGARGA